MASVLKHRDVMPQPGRLEWIGVSDHTRAEIRQLDEVTLHAGQGIEGQHGFEKGKLGDRQVTLLQYEHLAVMATLLGRDGIKPELLRRNLVVSGLNLLAVKNRKFRVGDLLLEGTGPCPPCARMEENLGEGGYNAMDGHGGISAQVLEGGLIRIGDSVAAVLEVDSNEEE